MSKRKDPRLAAAGGRTTIPAAEMEPPTRPQPGKQKTKVKRTTGSRLRGHTSRPDWLKPFAIVMLGLGLLYFAYSLVSSVNQTLKQNQRNAAISDVWRQLLTYNATISGSPTDLDETGTPSFPYISFEGAESKSELHRNIRLSTALPGIQSIGLSPESTRLIGRGYADDDSLVLIAQNYPALDTLSLSGSRITTLEPLADLQIRELRIVNTPIKREKLSTLELIPSITDLWLGWEPDIRDPDQAVFTTETYKLRLIESLSRMKNLRNLYVFNIAFDQEDLKKLPAGLNIKNLR